MATEDRSRPTGPSLVGAMLVLVQFDVCEEIRLDLLRSILGARTSTQPEPKHSAQGYVRYERPPVVEPIDELVLETGERLSGEIKYYDYGVLSVLFQFPFSGDWDRLIALASRWVWDVDFAAHARRIVHQRLESVAAAMTKPYA